MLTIQSIMCKKLILGFVFYFHIWIAKIMVERKSTISAGEKSVWCLCVDPDRFKTPPLYTKLAVKETDDTPQSLGG